MPNQKDNRLKPLLYGASFFLTLMVLFSAVYFWTYEDPTWAQLRTTIERGNVDALKALIERDPSLISKENELRFQPISVAAESGQLLPLKYLVSMGANIDHQSTFGTTPLMLASYNGHYSIVEFLIAQGANLDLKSAGGWTALIFAALGGPKGYLEIFEYLLSKGADTTYSDKASVKVRSNLSLLGRAQMIAPLDAHYKSKKEKGE